MLRRARWREGWAVVVCAFSVGLSGVAEAQAVAQLKLAEVLHGSGASAIVLEVGSGRVLAQVGDIDAQAAPGSAVKPFVLRVALESGTIGEHTTVHCDGALRVAGHNLACVHPRDVTVLDARQALAESCNTYFATVARRMSTEQMVAALRGSGLQVKRAPADVDQRELMGLGLEGVQASVRQMAAAYRGLAVWMAGGAPHATVVRDGLVASVETGVAHAAHVDGLTVAGKTGTVDVPGSGRSLAPSRGWFAGVVYGAGGQPERVVVMFVANGNGRDAAALARRVMVGWR